jgi:hypothetical protein
MTQGIVDVNKLEVKRKEKGNTSEATIAYHRKIDIFTYVQTLWLMFSGCIRLKIFSHSKAEITIERTKSMPPQHVAPWQQKERFLQYQQLKEARK